MNILFNGETIPARRISIDEVMTFMSPRALDKYCDSTSKLYISYDNIAYINLEGKVDTPPVTYIGSMKDIDDYIISHTLI